jgi:hypothetical protein
MYGLEAIEQVKTKHHLFENICFSLNVNFRLA